MSEAASKTPATGATPPQPTTVPPTAPAAAATPNAPAEPAAEPKPTPTDAGPAERDPDVMRLVTDLGYLLEEGTGEVVPGSGPPTPDGPKKPGKVKKPAVATPAAEPAAAPVATPTPAVPTPAPAPAAATPEEKKEKVRVQDEPSIEEIIERTVQVATAAKPPAAAAGAGAGTATTTEPAKPAPVVDPDEGYIAGLGEVEQHQIRLAEYAGKKYPELAGLKKEFVQFYRKIEDYIAKGRKDDPERTFDEGDEDYQKWLRRNTPKVSPVKLEQARLAMLKEEAVAEAERRAEERMRGELDEIRYRQHVMETTPRVQGALKAYEKEVVGKLTVEESGVLKEVIEAIREKGWEQAEEEDPLLVPQARQRHEQYVKRAGEWLGIANLLKQVDASNPDHVWLHQFITAQTQRYVASGKTTRTVNGRVQQFLPRAQYVAVLQQHPEKAGDYYTFSDEDVLAMIRAEEQREVLGTLKETVKRLEKGRYRREKAAPAAASSAPAETPAAEPASPRAPQSSSPGLASGSVKETKQFSAGELAAMGVPEEWAG